MVGVQTVQNCHTRVQSSDPDQSVVTFRQHKYFGSGSGRIVISVKTDLSVTLSNSASASV